MRTVALMGALAVVAELPVRVQAGLERLGAFGEGLAEGDRKELLLQRAVEALAETVSFRCAGTAPG